MTFIKDAMKEILISLTISISDNSFTSESLTTKYIFFNNEISYLLKSLINIEAVNYSFINEVIAQIIYN